MVNSAFQSVIYENASGKQAILSDPGITKWWELRGRSGFTAPDVDLITQEYIGGRVKLLKSIRKPRIIKLNMIVTGESRSQRDVAFFSMIDTIMDTTKGDQGKLYITRSDGIKLYLNCAYSSGLNVVDQYKKFHRFTLEFYAADSYFYSIPKVEAIDLMITTPIVLADDLFLSDSFIFGLGNANGSMVIDNKASVVLNPIYRLSGKRSSLRITNSTAEQTINFTGLSMEEGDTIVIDTREWEKKIYIEHYDGSTESAISHLDWSNVALDLQILPGQNSFEVVSFGTENQLTITTETVFLSA